MLKKFLIPLFLLGLGSVSITSCNKKSASTEPITASQLTHSQKGVGSILDLLGGIQIQAHFRSGCYHIIEEFYPTGVIKRREITCTSPCKVCEGTGGGGTGLTKNEDGKRGLSVPVSVEDREFYGMVATTSNNSGLIFAIDRTKISDAAYANYFADDFLVLDNGYVLDDNAYEMLGITRQQQIIPAGTYELFEDGDLIWWIVPNHD